MKYSPELATQYSESKEEFSETDKRLFSTLESIGVKGKTVLDLGCGDGKHLKRIQEMGAAQLVGVDVNERMIEIAQNKFPEGVHFFVGDGTSLPLETGSIDIVVSNFVLHYFHDTRMVFSEISRILKESGHFVGTFNVTDVEPGFEHLYNQEMPIRLGVGEKSIVVKNLIKSSEEIKTALTEASLELLQIEELEHPTASIDEMYPDKDKIHKRAMLYVLQKTKSTSAIE